MGVLQRFERRIESLVNRPFAKAFRAEVQPVEVASALQRELDQHAHYVSRDRTMVPNVFAVELGQHDFERLDPYAEPLTGELADMVREHAQDQAYSFIGPVEVTLERVPDLDTGIFRIRSTGHAPAAPPSRAPGPEWPAAPPARAAQPARDDWGSAPQPRSEGPALEIDGRAITLRTTVTVLGRGNDVDVKVDDPGVSRRHAELRVDYDGSGYRRPGSAPEVRAEVIDLGSTNGVRVDDRPVGRATLRDGDAFVIGQTRVVFRAGRP